MSAYRGPAAHREKMEKRRQLADERKAARLKERARHIIPDYNEYAAGVVKNAEDMQKHLSFNRCKLSDEQKARHLLEMRASDAPLLFANNPTARLRMYSALFPHAMNFGFGNDLYLFTFAARKYAFPLSQAGTFNPLSLKSTVIQWLHGFNGWFIIEPGLHTNLPPLTSAEPWDSEHVHGVIIGPPAGSTEYDIDALRKRVAEMAAKYTAFRVGRLSAEIKPIRNMAMLTGYLGKEPYTEYRIKTSEDVILIGDDEFEEDPWFNDPGYFRGIARPGLQLKIRNLMRGRLLDKRIFGVGPLGRQMVDQVVADALAELHLLKPEWDIRKADRTPLIGTFERDEDAFPLERDDPSDWLRVGSAKFDLSNVHIKLEPKTPVRKRVRKISLLKGL